MNRLSALILVLAFAALVACAHKHGDSTAAALSALEQEARRGDVYAQYELGMSYYNGRYFGAPAADMKDAAFWFKNAADSGLPEAQFMLAVIYLNPDSPDALQKTDKAEALLISASDRGNVSALYLLGKMYARGGFGTKRPVEAAKLLLLAESGGHPLAKNELDDLTPHMTRAQIAEANRLVVGWKAVPAVGQSIGSWEIIEDRQMTKEEEEAFQKSRTTSP